jgi:hypothetical protein
LNAGGRNALFNQSIPGGLIGIDGTRVSMPAANDGDQNDEEEEFKIH